MLPLVPGLGFGVHDAPIWVNIGPINFQPGEFAKLALAIFFAGYLADNRELLAHRHVEVGPFRLPEPRHLLPILLAWGIAVVIMVGRPRPRFVAALLRPVRRRHVGGHPAPPVTWSLGFVLFGAAAYVSWRLFGHVQTRVNIWLDPWADPLDSGYQIVQAITGSPGGVAGSGLGLGTPGRCRRRRPTSSSPRSARSWACRAPRRCWSPTCC